MLYFIQKGCSSSDTQDKKSLLRFQFEENDTILWYFCKRRLQAWCLFPWLRSRLPSEPDTAVLYGRFWAKIHRVYNDISWTASRTSFRGKRSWMVSVSFMHECELEHWNCSPLLHGFFIYIPLQLKRVVSELYTVDKARSNDDFFPTPPFSVASYLCLFQLRHCVYWFCSLFSSALLFLIAFFSSAIAGFIFSLWSLLPRFFCMCCGFCSVSLKCVQLCLEDLSLKQTVCHKPFQPYLLSIEIRKTTITSCDWYRKRKPPCQPLDTKVNQSRLGYAHFLRLFGAWWLFLLFLSAVVIILVVVLQHPPKMQFTSYLNVPVGNFPHFLWVHCESVRQSWFVTLFLISGRRF